jgi:predicted RNA binding protein YcfA (HicA-like mRNA interferase family)
MIAEVEEQGWVFVRWHGSHRQFTHPTLPGVVTIPGHPNDDLAPGLVSAIRRQAKGTAPHRP